MPTFDQMFWLPICAGLTGVGVVAAFLAFRRRGVASGLRLLGWAVLPMALWLSGLVRFLYTVVAEAVRWVGNFVFSWTIWTGVALFGVAFVLFGTAAFMRRRQGRTTGSGDKPEKAEKPAKSAKSKAEPKQVGKGKPADNPLEDMEDIDDILKRRGIE